MWAQDEGRIGLQHVLRRIWAPVGCRPTAVIRPSYKWLYVYAFVEPSSGETFWLFLPRVDTETFALALQEFADHVGASSSNRVALVLDNAGWHRTTQLEVPEGIDLVFLPPYAPELQPAERLWPELHQFMANQYFESLDHLEEALIPGCRYLINDSDRVRRLTNYHWWADALSAIN